MRVVADVQPRTCTQSETLVHASSSPVSNNLPPPVMPCPDPLTAALPMSDVILPQSYPSHRRCSSSAGMAAMNGQQGAATPALVVTEPPLAPASLPPPHSNHPQHRNHYGVTSLDGTSHQAADHHAVKAASNRHVDSHVTTASSPLLSITPSLMLPAAHPAGRVRQAPALRSHTSSYTLPSTPSFGSFAEEDGSSESDEAEQLEETIRLMNALCRPAGSHGHSHSQHHARNHSWAATKVTARSLQEMQAASNSSRRSLDSQGRQRVLAMQPSPLGPDRGVMAPAASEPRQRSSYHLTTGPAAVELFLRLNHARQTLDFTKRQAASFAALDHGVMGVWEALDMLDELREYEAALLAELQLPLLTLRASNSAQQPTPLQASSATPPLPHPSLHASAAPSQPPCTDGDLFHSAPAPAGGPTCVAVVGQAGQPAGKAGQLEGPLPEPRSQPAAASHRTVQQACADTGADVDTCSRSDSGAGGEAEQLCCGVPATPSAAPASPCSGHADSSMESGRSTCCSSGLASCASLESGGLPACNLASCLRCASCPAPRPPSLLPWPGDSTQDAGRLARGSSTVQAGGVHPDPHPAPAPHASSPGSICTAPAAAASAACAAPLEVAPRACPPVASPLPRMQPEVPAQNTRCAACGRAPAVGCQGAACGACQGRTSAFSGLDSQACPGSGVPAEASQRSTSHGPEPSVTGPRHGAQKSMAGADTSRGLQVQAAAGATPRGKSPLAGRAAPRSPGSPAQQRQEAPALSFSQLHAWLGADVWHSMAPCPLTPSMSLKEHAVQSAELCRLLFPDLPWLHLTALIHGLGKLLAHARFGTQPQWAVCGESYPLGCKFDSHIAGATYFSANPDKRRRAYQTPLGVYSPHCGLDHVYMSWGAQEYLHNVLLLNSCSLPPEALFLIRHLRFSLLTQPGTSYRHLLSPGDESLLPLLRMFQRLTSYCRMEVPNRLSDAEIQSYYSGLVSQYLPPQLLW